MPLAPPYAGRYSLPIHRLLVPIGRVLLGLPSSSSRDAALLLRHAHPAPRIEGAEHIPPDGPLVLVINHYDRPGLGAWWGGAAILCAVAGRRTAAPRDIHMAIAREWWYPNGIGRLIKQPLTHWFFGQLAKTYGFMRLPPALNRPEFRGQGALEIRRACAWTRHDRREIVGLAPEGRTGEGFGLCQPPAGAGLLLLLLTHESVPCVPVGLFEQSECGLVVRFGNPFCLSVDPSLARTDRDRAAASSVMIEIGRLLPESMWGNYRGEISGQAAASQVASPGPSHATDIRTGGPV